VLDEAGFAKEDFYHALDVFAQVYDHYPDYASAYDDPVREGREYVDQYKDLIAKDEVGQAMVVDIQNKLRAILKTLEFHSAELKRLLADGVN
jgi:hypothetical protein